MCLHCAAFWTVFIFSCRINMHNVIIYPVGFLLISVSHLPCLPPKWLPPMPHGVNYVQLWVTEAPPLWGWLQSQSTPVDSEPGKCLQDWGSQEVLKSIATWAYNRQSQRQMARKNVASYAIHSSSAANSTSTVLPGLPFPNLNIVIWIPAHEYYMAPYCLQDKVKYYPVVPFPTMFYYLQQSHNKLKVIPVTWFQISVPCTLYSLYVGCPDSFPLSISYTFLDKFTSHFLSLFVSHPLSTTK